MAKSRVAKKRMFRDVSFMKERYLGYNCLKNLRNTRESFCKAHEVSASHLEFMLWAYDLEFFTIDYVAEEYGMNKSNVGKRMIYPMVKQDLIYKHFDKLTPSRELEDHMFREETKFNYRVRYALTQRARLLVQRFYNALD